MPEPFAGATGRGVRVAVIDSGVNPRHPHVGPVGSGVAVTMDGAIVEGEDAALDQLGHGTAVTAAIQEKAPDAGYLPVRVFHTSLRTTAATLIRAIDWCIAERVDIVNLSLGSPNAAHADAFAAVVARAARAGVLLVAAREANEAPCYPGCLPTVLGVGLDWDCPRDACRIEAGVLHASGYPRPIPGVPPRRNLYGISFAVANMTGLAARACERTGGGAERIVEALAQAAEMQPGR